ncbi:unnamed protein product [Acanthoscelides obtectus]|uniref:PHD-type domain-containing protein n=1 Tax=Acanthoscelides obtectus TaxID=200917 RepID=A0A9P0Q1A6_ACAOB|nr:unnamed protein product [Acanthoscelides obtectus]CAK1620561.1 Transcription initiation factor IIA subunit 1 [Acanthoscelides obtectus]
MESNNDVCGACNRDFNARHNFVKCNLCSTNFHLACASVKYAWLNVIEDCDNLLWLCDKCKSTVCSNNAHFKAEITTLNKEIDCLSLEKQLTSKTVEDLEYTSLLLQSMIKNKVLLELKQTWESKLLASKAVQSEQEERVKKQEQQHAASNGFPKVVNNPVPQGVPVQQQPTQQPIAPQIQQIVETKQVPIQITLPPQPGSDGTQRVLTIQVPASALQGNQLQKVLTGPVITATMGLPVTIASSLLQQHVNAALSSQQQAQGQQPTVLKTVGQTDGNCDYEDGAGCSQVRSNDMQIENILVKKIVQGDSMDNDDSDEGFSIEIIVPTTKRNRIVSSQSKRTTHQRPTPGTSSSADPTHPAQCDGAADTSDDDDDASDDADGDDDDPDDDKQDDDDEMEDEGGEEEPLNSEDDVTDDDPADLFETDNIVVCQYDKIIRNRNKWKFYLKDGIMNLNGTDYVFQKATGDAEW